MINDILVARDFSTSSDRALQSALQWAELLDATVHLLAVQVTNDNPFAPAEQRSGPLERLRTRLKSRTQSDMAESGYDPGSVAVKHEVQRGEAAGPAIVRYAKRAGIDLIMMGTTGRRGMTRAFMGSVAEEVVRTAPCPVCTVRAGNDMPAPERPRRLVIPVDFSEPSRMALAYGVRLAKRFNTSIALLHAIENPSVPLVYGSSTPVDPPAGLGERVEAGLLNWFQEVTPEGIETPAHEVLIRTSAPGKAIRQEASRKGDVVLMATEGRTGMERMVLGSVAESVLRRTEGPVVTARSFEAALLPK